MGTRHDPRGPIRPLSSCGPGRANTGARRARYARPGFGRAQDALRSEEKTSGPGTRVLALPKKSVSFYLRVSAYGTRWALAESRIPCPHVGVSARLAAPGLLACWTDGRRGPGCAVSCPPPSSPSLLPPVRTPPHLLLATFSLPERKNSLSTHSTLAGAPQCTRHSDQP